MFADMTYITMLPQALYAAQWSQVSVFTNTLSTFQFTLFTASVVQYWRKLIVFKSRVLFPGRTKKLSDLQIFVSEFIYIFV